MSNNYKIKFLSNNTLFISKVSVKWNAAVSKTLINEYFGGTLHVPMV